MSAEPAAAVKVAVAGPRGRMGRAVAAAVTDAPGVELVARFDRDPGISDETGVVDRERALALADVVIDFTTGAASASLARAAAKRGCPALVIGSTGLTEDEEAAVRAASERVAIVQSGNFSLGVNLLLSLVEQAARLLGPGTYDIEVFEAHHRRKRDAPSGTALMLGEAAAAARGVALADVAVRSRDGLTGPRVDGEIGFSVMRGGGIVGEHSVVLAAADEIITLSHSARDRGLFARGAVEAARWVAPRPPGLYSMKDVLGL